MSCFVADCRHNSRREECSMFRFPLDLEERDFWEYLCRRHDRSLNIENDRICSCHFIDNKKSNGPPSIFPWGENNRLHKRIRGKPEEVTETLSLGQNARRSNFKKTYCCVCYEPTKHDDAVALLDQDQQYSQFGLVVCSILKFDHHSLMTRYCCRTCNQQVMECFNLLIDINVSAMLTSNRLVDETLMDALERGCILCDTAFPTVEELTDHFVTHVLEEQKKTFEDADTQTENMNSMRNKAIQAFVLPPMAPSETQTDITCFGPESEGEVVLTSEDISKEHCYNKKEAEKAKPGRKPGLKSKKSKKKSSGEKIVLGGEYFHPYLVPKRKFNFDLTPQTSPISNKAPVPDSQYMRRKNCNSQKELIKPKIHVVPVVPHNMSSKLVISTEPLKNVAFVKSERIVAGYPP